MAKIVLNNFDLSDIKKIMEEVIEEKLIKINPTEKKESSSLLSRKETAQFLCISLPTLHDWTKNGIVKGYRIGNRVLYKREEIKESLKQINSSNKFQC